MFLEIRHTTTYSYGHSVILEPHTIRLTPRVDAYRKLIERNLTIFPEPDGLSVNLDFNGCLSHMVWFKRPTGSLKVVSRVILELNELNPFDYLVHPPECLNLPMVYPKTMRSELKPFLQASHVHEKIMHFSSLSSIESKKNVLDFAGSLCRKVRETCAYETRQLGVPHAPEEVLAQRKGSCRDLTVLYIEAARAMGLAARFVSGYYFDESPKHPQLHAWAEVYIPGGGWRGYDPTLGLACYGHHIPLAASANPAQTAAIEGNFLGRPESQMEVHIEYEYLKQIPKPQMQQ